MKSKRLILFCLFTLVLSACSINIGFQTAVPCYNTDAEGNVTFPIRINLPRFSEPLDFDVPTSRSYYRFSARDLVVEVSLNFTGGLSEIAVRDRLSFRGNKDEETFNFKISELPPCEDIPPALDLSNAIREANNPACGFGTEVIAASMNLQKVIWLNDPIGNSILDALPSPNIPLQNEIINEIWTGDSCGVEDLAAENPSELTPISNVTLQNCLTAQGISPSNLLTTGFCQLNDALNDLKNNTLNGNPNLCKRAGINCQSERDYEFYWYLGEAYRKGTCKGFPDQFGGEAACQNLLPPPTGGPIPLPEVLPPPPPLD